jgi:hypothetical protein
MAHAARRLEVPPNTVTRDAGRRWRRIPHDANARRIPERRLRGDAAENVRNRSGDNPRRELQNVVAHSSARVRSVARGSLPADATAGGEWY